MFLLLLLAVGTKLNAQDTIIINKALPQVDEINDQKQHLIDSLQKRGFLEARLKSFSIEDSVLMFKFISGPKYKWGDIQFSGDVIAEDKLEKTITTLKTADQFELSSILSTHSDRYYFNNGYPFAEFDLIIDSVNNQQLFVKLMVNAAQKITYDSLKLTGDSMVIKQKYLQKLLKLSYGKAFNTADFLSISDRIAYVESIQLSKDPDVAFRNRKAEVQLKLDKLNVNTFDGFLGFIPRGGRTIITGQADLKIHNLFRSGIFAGLEWQQYNADDRNLELQSSQLASIKSGIGYVASFSLLQEDSTFLQNALKIGINAALKDNYLLKVYYKRNQTSILRDFSAMSDTDTVFRSSTINSVGLQIDYQQLRIYPTLENSISYSFSASAGQKYIPIDQGIPTEWLAEEARTFNLSSSMRLQYNHVFWKRFLLETNLNISYLSNTELSRNDLFRLGGLKSLRGFEQNQFYEQYYALMSFNYRFYLNNQSNIFFLSDLAHLSSETPWLYSFGAGTDVKTANGWFRIIYAIGNNFQKNINFNDAKLHIGYIAVF